MTPSHTARSVPERNRFGRVVRIPTPTPLGVGDVNVYALLPPAGGDAVTLIDTGVKSPEAFEALRCGLKEHGFSLSRIERILVTHAHLDHYGQAQRLRELTGARVYASRVEAAAMTGYPSPTGGRSERLLAWYRRWGVPEDIARHDDGLTAMMRRYTDPIEVDHVLDDGDCVAIGDLRLETVATPGHCDGHVCYWEPELGALFSGDHLLPDISPVPLLVIPEDERVPRPRSLARFMASLARVEALSVRHAFPSHGEVIRDPGEVIAGYRLHHERRKLQVLRALRKRPLSPFELARRLFPRHYREQLYLVMSEVIGHLEVLEEEGLVRIGCEAGVEIVERVVPTPEAAG